MNRLAVACLCLALLAAVLTVSGLLGELEWLARVTFLASLTLFIVSAAASALWSHPPA